MKKDYIFKDINTLIGVGPQLSKYLKKRRIEKIKDIILSLPYDETDRSKLYKLNELEIGKIQSIKVLVKKLNKIKSQKSLETLRSNGGEGGIRTHERVAPLLVFKTSAFNRSATSP